MARAKDYQELPDTETAQLGRASAAELVPQDPNDEPASELLTRIQQERAAISDLAKVAKNPKKPVHRKTKVKRVKRG